MPDVIHSAAEFFADSQQELHMDRSQGWIASRVALDPANSQAKVGVVLELRAEE